MEIKHIKDINLDIINQRHRTVSAIKTPPAYISRIEELGLDYPNIEFMRAVADEFYPGWSWELNGNPIILFNKEGMPIEVVVRGTLTWLESIDHNKEKFLVRKGSMVASQAIKYTKSGKPLDMSNDIKAANSNCIKKAFSLYLNICDDVYRWEDPRINEEMETKLKEELEKVNEKQRKELEKKLVEPFLVNKGNFNSVILRIKAYQNKGE